MENELEKKEKDIFVNSRTEGFADHCKQCFIYSCKHGFIEQAILLSKYKPESYVITEIIRNTNGTYTIKYVINE